MQGPADVFRGAFFMPREARHQRAAGGASFPKTHSICARAAPSLSPGGKRLRASGAAREIPSSAKRPAMDGRRRLRLRNPPPAEKARHRNKKKLPPLYGSPRADLLSVCDEWPTHRNTPDAHHSCADRTPLPAPELRPGTIRLRGHPPLPARMCLCPEPCLCHHRRDGPESGFPHVQDIHLIFERFAACA